MEYIPEVIKALSEALAIPAKEIISHYSGWMVTASISYICLGLTLLLCTAGSFYMGQREREDGYMILAAIMLLTGLAFIFFNTADLFHPEAAAIRQLLHDITSSKD